MNIHFDALSETTFALLGTEKAELAEYRYTSWKYLWGRVYRSTWKSENGWNTMCKKYGIFAEIRDNERSCIEIVKREH